MNCCNDYGKCTNGKDCAARSKAMPIDVALPDDPDYDVSVAWIERAGIFAFVTVLLTIGFVLGRFTA